jgi:hypothetical protein
VTDENWRDLRSAMPSAGTGVSRGSGALQVGAHAAPDSADANSIYGLMLLHLNCIDEAAPCNGR